MALKLFESYIHVHFINWWSRKKNILYRKNTPKQNGHFHMPQVFQIFKKFLVIFQKFRYIFYIATEIFKHYF